LQPEQQVHLEQLGLLQKTPAKATNGTPKTNGSTGIKMNKLEEMMAKAITGKV
jgi:hypothetical protein